MVYVRSVKPIWLSGVIPIILVVLACTLRASLQVPAPSGLQTLPDSLVTPLKGHSALSPAGQLINKTVEATSRSGLSCVRVAEVDVLGCPS